MSIAGKFLYHAWHRPVNTLRDVISAGGPIQIRRTEQGRREMETAACHLPALPQTNGTPLEVHLLTGRRFWYQTAFCLWTFARQTGRPIAPVICDDGTLASEHREPITRLFPAARFVAHHEICARLDAHLPVARYPFLRERWANYPNIRKLTDVHAGRTGWKLVLDSDLLFFRRPDFLLAWLDGPDRPLHAVDCENSYGYSRALMNELSGKAVADLVNVGLTGLNSSALEWDRLESWTRTLITREKTSYYLEQALVAMLIAGQECAIAPAGDYVTRPVPPESLDCRAVMHHYVASSKRWYFQHCWRQVLAGVTVDPGQT
jgi:hypothetical protein